MKTYDSGKEVDEDSTDENNYRHFKTDKQAIQGFKLMAYVRYAKLTDITKKQDNKWTRIQWS